MNSQPNNYKYMNWFENRIGTFAGGLQAVVFALMDSPYIYDSIVIVAKLVWIAVGAGVGTATQHYLKKYLEKKEK